MDLVGCDDLMGWGPDSPGGRDRLRLSLEGEQMWGWDKSGQSWCPWDCPQNPWGSRSLLRRALGRPPPPAPPAQGGQQWYAWRLGKSSGRGALLLASQRNPEAETPLPELADWGVLGLGWGTPGGS